jgi:CHAD domain-containing protein
MRLRPLRRAVRGVAEGRKSAVHAARTATRRLRELIPLLAIEKPVARKLMRRLRKAGRQLGRTRDMQTQRVLVDGLIRADRQPGGPLLRHLRDTLSAEAERQADRLNRAKLGTRLGRCIEAIERLAGDLGQDAHHESRALRWAADARVTRRAGDVRAAVHQAGALYEPEQLHRVRIAVKKLRYAAELVADASGRPASADLRFLKRVQDLLGRQHDAQVLLDLVRATERTFGGSSIATWREGARVIGVLDGRCRRLHARFIRDRAALLAVCDRLGASVHQRVALRRQVR